MDFSSEEGVDLCGDWFKNEQSEKKKTFASVTENQPSNLFKL